MTKTIFHIRVLQLMGVIGVALFGYIAIAELRPFEVQRSFEVQNWTGAGAFVIEIPFGLNFQVFENSDIPGRNKFVLVRDRISVFNEILADLDCPEYLSTENHLTNIELWASEGKAYLSSYVIRADKGEVVEDAPMWKPAEERTGNRRGYVAVLKRDEDGLPLEYATCLYGPVNESVKFGACQLVYPVFATLYVRALLQKIDRRRWPDQIAAITCFALGVAKEIS